MCCERCWWCYYCCCCHLCRCRLRKTNMSENVTTGVFRAKKAGSQEPDSVADRTLFVYEESVTAVPKSASDPGSSLMLGAAAAAVAAVNAAGQKPSLVLGTKSKSAKKCLLTLDGYSYVIVANPPDSDLKTINYDCPTSENADQLGNELLTILRRSSDKKMANKEFFSLDYVSDDVLDNVDLSTDILPPINTPEACSKAALRLRCLLRQLNKGKVAAELLQRNLQYAACVLDTLFITNNSNTEMDESSVKSSTPSSSSASALTSTTATTSNSLPKIPRKLLKPIWAARCMADEDDELSEVRPDAVPPEVREWLASTFTRQVASAKKRNEDKPKFRTVAHAIRAGIFVDRIYRRVINTSLMQFPLTVIKVLKTIDEWSFDIFALSEASNAQPIKYLAYDLLNRYGIIHKFKVQPTVLENFLNRIEDGYSRHLNPYHNNLHAADVTQSVHFILCQTGLMNWLSDLEIFAVLFAALIHDFEHTGTTNNFHVMSDSEMALLYNDRAVLENHHISATFRLLREEDCNILQNLSKDEFREFRALVIDMVLATDMSYHFQQIKNIKSVLSIVDGTIDKSKALSLVLHCCDISHPAKKWNLHNKWTKLLLEEFFRQGDKECEMGLSFSPLCDRKNTLIAESQIGFIEFIVEPSMAICSDILEHILQPVHSNLVARTGTGTGSGSTSDDVEGGSGGVGGDEEEDDDVVASGQPQAQQNQAGQMAASEVSADGGGGGSGGGFRIPKPWIECLAENKKNWKDQAVIDAEARATAAAAAAASTTGIAPLAHDDEDQFSNIEP